MAHLSQWLPHLKLLSVLRSWQSAMLLRLSSKIVSYTQSGVMQAIQEAAPLIAAFQRDRTLITMLSLYLPTLPLHSQLVKVQLNAGTAMPSCNVVKPTD